jgi:tetratricopeptide (TPR) repeat protein
MGGLPPEWDEDQVTYSAEDVGPRVESLVALVTNNLASVLVEQGEYARAVQLLEESMAIKQELGDKRGIARSLIHLGRVAYLQGQYKRATSLLEQSLKQFEEIEDEGGVAWALRFLANVSEEMGEYDRAQSQIKQCLSVYRRMDFTLPLHNCFMSLGRIALMSAIKQRDRGGKSACTALLTRAARLFGASERLREMQTTPLLPSEAASYERALRQAATLTADLHAESTWKAAWKQGRAMTVEQALSYAIDEDC